MKYNINSFHSRGIVLIEIIVALVVFAISIIPLFNLMDQSMRVSRFTHEVFAAENYSLELIEQIAVFSDIPDELIEFNVNNAPDGRSFKLKEDPLTTLSLSPMPDSFTRTLTIRTVNPYLKSISSTVSWGESPDHEVTNTIFVDYQP